MPKAAKRLNHPTSLKISCKIIARPSACTVLYGDGGWQVRCVDVEEKGCQVTSLKNAVLEATQSKSPY